MSRPWPALLLLLSGIGCARPAPEEDWAREARAQQAEWAQQAATRGPDRGGHQSALEDLLTKPDPPAAPGPALRLGPAPGEPFAWPPPRSGVLTVRYRIAPRACGLEDCHLTALCPDEPRPGARPSAYSISARSLEAPARTMDERESRDHIDQIEIPSPRCELRLFGRDFHFSAVCTARGPQLPASWEGAAVLDLGRVEPDNPRCEMDRLAARQTLRHHLALGWQERSAKKNTP